MESESELMPPKAFDFFEGITSYDTKESPSNGYEYLYQVIIEASKTPQTKVANIDIDRFKKNQTVYVEEKETSDVPIDFIPSKEWQEFQLINFEKVRQYVHEMRLIWDKKDTNYKLKFLPSLSSEETAFQTCIESMPFLRTILSLSQPGLDSLLDYHVQWLEEGKIDFCKKTNMWLFSILACLEEPLDPNICSNLRCIIRSAKTKRSTLRNVNDELLLPLNVLICIASKFFRQNDLGD